MKIKQLMKQIMAFLLGIYIFYVHPLTINILKVCLSFCVTCRVDMRSNNKTGQSILIHKKGSKVVGLHCNPVQPELLLSCGNDHFVSFYFLLYLVLLLLSHLASWNPCMYYGLCSFLLFNKMICLEVSSVLEIEIYCMKTSPVFPETYKYLFVYGFVYVVHFMLALRKWCHNFTSGTYMGYASTGSWIFSL